jgi:hypothetical protein
MQTVDEQPETIHLYVVREEAPKPSLFSIVLSFVALSLVIAIGVLSPNQQPEQRASLRVPAVLASLKTFRVQVQVVPTGVKTYPATTAHGVLTITNGSVISQTLPASLTFISTSGVSVITDTAVFVPAGNANGYGWATVAAHLATPGINLPAHAVNQVLGTYVYVRNLRPFTGGRPAYSVKYATEHDKVDALQRARSLLAAMVSGLHYPCNETYGAAAKIEVTWHCQMLTYHIAAFYHVTGVKLIGKNLLLTVWFIPRPAHVWVK